MNYIGEIKIFTGEFNPPGFIDCDGSLLPIALYRELFLVIGYKYNQKGSSKTEKYFQLPVFDALLRGSKFIICVDGYFPRPIINEVYSGKTAVIIQRGNLDSSFEDSTAKVINKYRDITSFDEEWGNFNPNTDEFEN